MTKPLADLEELPGLMGKLTEAQRRVVLTNDRGFADHAKGKWFSPTIVIARKPHGYGLIETPEHLARPTELGLAARKALGGS
jgi:hypothetical protein